MPLFVCDTFNYETLLALRQAAYAPLKVKFDWQPT